MTTITVTKHAFLTPAHNSWNIWTCDGSQSITNPGTSHRVLESLSFAIDTMVSNGWKVEQIVVDQGTPSLVFLTRQDTIAEG